VIATPSAAAAMSSGASEPTAATSGGDRTYVVVRGDTLSAIAARFEVTLASLLEANPGLEPDGLMLGDRLVIPPPDRQRPDATPKPAPPPTPKPSPPPTATPEPTSPPLVYRAGVLRTNGFANVLVTGLRVRSEPSTGSTVLWTGPVPGDRMFVVAGPVEAEGYTWYELAHPDSLAWDGPAIGWVAAAGADGERWLAGLEPVCPPFPPDVERLPELTPFERLACFGSRPITYDGNLGFWTDDFGPWYPWGTPDWLNGLLVYGVGSPFGDPRFAPDAVRSEPDQADADPAYRVTGHVDDPASATCRGGMEDASKGPPVRTEGPRIEQVLGCRTRFVITAALGLHRIVAGETVSGIAESANLTVQALLAANPHVADPRLLHVGELLVLPPMSSR
jgi:LysM repeat protein